MVRESTQQYSHLAKDAIDLAIERQLSILVVDDDEEVCRVISSILSPRGYAVTSVHNGVDALSQLGAVDPDVIILDINMPGLSGLEVCRRVRRVNNTPIIMLSSISEESTRTTAYQLGANDYMTKPFAAGDLLAHIRAVHACAHAASTNGESPVRVGAVEIDLNTGAVIRQGNEVHLSQEERLVLLYLVRNSNCVITARAIDDILDHEGCKASAGNQRTIINGLRKKIEVNPLVPRVILTEGGIGYRLVLSRH